MKQSPMKFVSKHKRVIFLSAAIIFVCAGQVEFIPYTVAAAMEILGAATAAVVAANELWQVLSPNEGTVYDDPDDIVDSYSEDGEPDVTIFDRAHSLPVRSNNRLNVFDDRLCDKYIGTSGRDNS